MGSETDPPAPEDELFDAEDELFDVEPVTVDDAVVDEEELAPPDPSVESSHATTVAASAPAARKNGTRREEARVRRELMAGTFRWRGRLDSAEWMHGGHELRSETGAIFGTHVPESERPMQRFHLDLNDIAIFAAVVEAENLTRAARSLGLPKSTVSRKLAALEHRLGVRLLHRSPRRIDVTDAGRTLHAEAREALALLASAADRVGGSKDGLRGKVRLSAPVDLGVTLVGPLLWEFAKREPEITVEVEFADRKVDITQEGFDFVVRVGEVGDPALVARQVGVIRGHLVASAQYVAEHGVLARIEDVPAHKFIQFSPTGQFLDTMRFIRPDGGTLDLPFSGQLRLNSLAVARDAVLGGLGVARLPTYISRPHIDAGRLVHVLPGYWTEERVVRLVHVGRRLLPARVTKLIDWLARGMEEALGRR